MAGKTRILKKRRDTDKNGERIRQRYWINPDDPKGKAVKLPEEFSDVRQDVDDWGNKRIRDFLQKRDDFSVAKLTDKRDVEIKDAAVQRGKYLSLIKRSREEGDTLENRKSIFRVGRSLSYRERLIGVVDDELKERVAKMLKKDVGREIVVPFISPRKAIKEARKTGMVARPLPYIEAEEEEKEIFKKKKELFKKAFAKAAKIKKEEMELEREKLAKLVKISEEEQKRFEEVRKLEKSLAEEERERIEQVKELAEAREPEFRLFQRGRRVPARQRALREEAGLKEFREAIRDLRSRLRSGRIDRATFRRLSAELRKRMFQA